MKIRFLLAIIFLALFLGRSYPSDITPGREAFIKASIDYRQGNFEQAVSNYEQALESGLASGALYYNMGNAYFKNDNLGKAIVNYMRAKRFIPRDPDLRANIAYTRSLIKNNIMLKETHPLKRWFSGLSSNLTLDEATGILMSLYFLLAVIIMVFINIKRNKAYLFYVMTTVAMLLVFSCGIFYFSLRYNVLEKHAIVIAQGLEARFEPFENATVFFVLNQGQELVSLDKSNGWIRIRRPDGRQGWVKSDGIENI
jgi:tetratricopeptide (TPR) repeat protein